MDPGDLWQGILLAVCLILSAFFSASETALMSLSKIRIRNMVDENVKDAYKVQKLIENPSKLLGAILIGNNIVNIGASALATSLAIEYLGGTGVGIATGIMTILVLIFGEITPKSLAAQSSEKVSLKVVRLLTIIVTVLNPITTVLIHITNTIIKFLGGSINIQQPFTTVEELKTMINVSHEEGVLEAEEKKMIHNVFEFNDTKVADVMVPRVNMVAVEVAATYDEIINVFKDQRFSRLPVYEGTIDNIVGVLYLKDLIFSDIQKADFDIIKNMREPYFTFEFKMVAQLFNEMKDQIIPMAIVMDEYGGTAGIITMEDLVEEIVGDIQDEYDEANDEIEVVKEDEYIVRGIVKIDTVNEMLGTRFESEDFDSIGGFVTGIFGRLPKAGEQIAYNNTQFIVESTNRNRIEKLRILT
ncbi:HlyC/CorC family transporter [Cellulosilyticum sp. I15G10I2]|uniref:HlyC/CorC family transporter n=1 Tax=Cellulosilyticum sp. I15G10I2 TaxID=1892843 RepID=UPI00085C11F5|nr:hemolysin family protein [Cellulosilyticum sp. I15G10I2]